MKGGVGGVGGRMGWEAPGVEQETLQSVAAGLRRRRCGAVQAARAKQSQAEELARKHPQIVRKSCGLHCLRVLGEETESST